MTHLYYAPESGAELVTIPAEAVADCFHPGPCDDDVAYWLDRVEWHATDATLREHLDGYGAWDDLANASTEALRERTLWIACCDISEGVAL